MSANEYAADIFPDPIRRQGVLWSGGVLGLLGTGLIAMLPVELPLRGLLGLVWGASVLREIVILRRAFARCLRFRVTSGNDVSLLGPDGEWRAAELARGGILLSRLGWIRLRAAAEPAFGELLTGDRRGDPDWRRLHVIWRHFGA